LKQTCEYAQDQVVSACDRPANMIKGKMDLIIELIFNSGQLLALSFDKKYDVAHSIPVPWLT
jgi:hypothetical protein